MADLRQRLRAAGSELVVRRGRPEEVIAELVRRTGAGAVYCHSEVGAGQGVRGTGHKRKTLRLTRCRSRRLFCHNCGDPGLL